MTEPVNKSITSPREHFSSKIGFVLAAAGSAVGIGNLVGFPVAVTKNGGGAFLLLYDRLLHRLRNDRL